MFVIPFQWVSFRRQRPHERLFGCLDWSLGDGPEKSGMTGVADRAVRNRERLSVRGHFLTGRSAKEVGRDASFLRHLTDGCRVRTPRSKALNLGICCREVGEGAILAARSS